MKNLKLENLQADPIASALVNSKEETIMITGFICGLTESTISIAETRNATIYTEYPKEAIHSAFTTEKTCGKDDDTIDKISFLVIANANVKIITHAKARTSQIARMIQQNGDGCGSKCMSDDGNQTCCCLPGQRCEKWGVGCKCTDATEWPGMSSFPLTHQNSENPYSTQVAATKNYTKNSAQFGFPNFSCRTRHGVCPTICRPIIIEGRFYGYDCYCDCTNPIPDKSLG